MREAGVAHLARLEDPHRVEEAMASYLEQMRRGALAAPTLSDMSRQARAKAFAGLLEEARAEPRLAAHRAV
jgi:hypothetical protein